MTRSRLLDDDELAQLKLFSWFLILINVCIVGLGFFFASGLDDGSLAIVLITAVLVLVDGAFLLVVGGNILVVAVASYLKRRRGHSDETLLRSVV
jgi:hypothetical protein